MRTRIPDARLHFVPEHFRSNSGRRLKKSADDGSNCARLQGADRRGDQPRSGKSDADASAASWPPRGIGSNSENKTRPAKKPPICACQATLTSSEPTPTD